MAFAVRKMRCLSCKAPVDDHQTLCRHCAEHEAEVYEKRLAGVSALEEKYARLWTQCQRCQGSLHQDVLCTARDCPIFYMRKKVQKDLKDASDELARFDVSW